MVLIRYYLLNVKHLFYFTTFTEATNNLPKLMGLNVIAIHEARNKLPSTKPLLINDDWV